MKNTSQYKNGIVGTLLFHVVILCIAYASEIQQHPPQTFFVLVDPEILEETPEEKSQRLNEELDYEVEKLYEQLDRQEIKNITVRHYNNKIPATEFRQGMTDEEYEKEIVRNALSKTDFEKYVKNKPVFEENEETVPTTQAEAKPNTAQETNYRGPATVVYYLEGRISLYLDIPVYTCEGEALVTVNIEVNPTGKVVKSNIDPQSSLSSSDCYRKAALNSAQKALFSQSEKKSNQSGSIVYHFVPQ